MEGFTRILRALRCLEKITHHHTKIIQYYHHVETKKQNVTEEDPFLFIGRTATPLVALPIVTTTS